MIAWNIEIEISISDNALFILQLSWGSGRAQIKLQPVEKILLG